MTDEGLDAELAEIDQLRNKVSEYKQKESRYLKTIGDQGNQIGELRQVVGQQYKQLEGGKNPDDWDYDPQEQEIRQLKTQIGQIQSAEAVRQLESDFPGFRELPNNQEFMDWVGESPVRAELYRRADSMDLGSAREMLSLWKERENLKEELQVQGNTQRREALRAATMEKGSAGGARKAYWTRQELQQMRQNPSEWAANWPEIQKAYAEGRVR